MKMDCYVYYKAAQEHELQIVQQVKMMRVYLHTKLKVDLHANLQRRPEAENGVVTWMEIYRHVPHAFATALADVVNQTDIMTLIQGQRHAEYFEDAIPCA
jgi:hypothetical protein